MIDKQIKELAESMANVAYNQIERMTVMPGTGGWNELCSHFTIYLKSELPKLIEAEYKERNIQFMKRMCPGVSFYIGCDGRLRAKKEQADDRLGVIDSS